MPPPGGAAAPPNVNGAAASADGATATAGAAPAPNAGTADAGADPNVNPVDASDAGFGGFASLETFFDPSPSSALGAPNANAAEAGGAGGPSGFGGALFGSRAELELVFPPLKSRSAAPSRESSSPSRPFLLFERRIDPAPSARGRLGGAAPADPNENAGGATTAPASSLVFAAFVAFSAARASFALSGSGGRSMSSARTIFGSVAAKPRRRPRTRGFKPGERVKPAPILPFEPRTTSLTRPLAVVDVDETFGDGDEAANAASVSFADAALRLYVDGTPPRVFTTPTDRSMSSRRRVAAGASASPPGASANVARE